LHHGFSRKWRSRISPHWLRDGSPKALI